MPFLADMVEMQLKEYARTDPNKFNCMKEKICMKVQEPVGHVPSLDKELQTDVVYKIFPR